MRPHRLRARVTRQTNRGLLTVIATWGLLVIGAVMALFTSVSLVSGTTTVWLGVALTVVGAIVAFVTHQVVAATKIIAVLLVAASLWCRLRRNPAPAQRDELSNLVNN